MDDWERTEQDRELGEMFSRREAKLLKGFRAFIYDGQADDILDRACGMIHHLTRVELPGIKKRIDNAGGYTIPLVVRYDGLLSHYEKLLIKLNKEAGECERGDG